MPDGAVRCGYPAVTIVRAGLMVHCWLNGTGYAWKHGKTSDTLTNFPAWARALCT